MRILKNIELIKFPELDEIDAGILENNLSRFLDRLQLGDNDVLSLSYKEYSKGGLRKQHEIKAKLVFSGKTFSASETDWKFLETIQTVLKKIEKEVLKSTSK
ncbi:MAG: hypothetical protein PHX27_00105 [Candidatus ainarchaeum sp.]|nr:hypothetical protein [Candidatus ainarchaeum sp.]